MKALLIRELGPIENHSVEDVDDPVAGPGELVVDVKAAGLNFPDTLIIQGKYQFRPEMPFTPGGEGAGFVSQVGEGVKGFKVGDKVGFLNSIGCFAEKVKLPAASVMVMPESMSTEVAAGFTLTYGTSYHALKQRAQLQPGETVFVMGAAGGVGIAAVELAKAMGAKVIAGASTDEKLSVCKKAGADELINYTTEDMKSRLKELTEGKGVDVIYDPVGGDFAEPALRSMAVGGRYLVIGFAAGDIPKIPLNLTLLKQCSIVGVFWGAWLRGKPHEHLENMQEMFKMFEDGKLKPLVDDVYSLADFKSAFNCLTDRKAKGKVILAM